MRELDINDRCYKFFFANSENMYESYKKYSGSKRYFFRRDEAIGSAKHLLYLMEYGDMLAEIVVDELLVNNALEVSPKHFVADTILIGEIYNASSTEMTNLVLDTLMNCSDFSKTYFRDIVIKLISYKAFDTALEIYNIINRERNVKFADIDIKLIAELGSQPWRRDIPIEKLDNCRSIEEYIEFMKDKVDKKKFSSENNISINFIY